MGMVSDAFDVVKVDLSDGRDYPIYIGSDFGAEEGECGAFFSPPPPRRGWGEEI
jgi:hypothetical protein